MIASTATATATIPKLYLLSNDDPFELLYVKLTAALATQSVSWLQLRRKQLLTQPQGYDKLRWQAREIGELCQRYQVALIINDDLPLANELLKLGLASGVHLGQGDGSVQQARQLLGSDAIIGRTCHDQIALVQQAKADGASYAAMGAVFASPTKPNAQTITHQQLVAGCEQGIPICVIGGLTVDNISDLSGLAIASVAVVSDVLDQPLNGVADRCRQWQQALNNWG